MANKDFGVKKIELIGSSGTPNLTSPTNLNLNASTVAISTDVTIGGKVQSDVIVGSGYSVGIGSTFPQQALDVSGTIRATTFVKSDGSVVGAGDTANIVTGIITAVSYYGDGSTLSGIANVSIGDAAPSPATDNTLWWSSDLAKGFIRYNDGNSSQWVEFSPSGGGGSGNIVGLSTSGNSYFTNIDVSNQSNLTNLSVSGVSTFTSDVNLGDGDKAVFGADDDFEIYHNGSDGYIDNATGELYIRDTNASGTNRIFIQPKSGEDGIIAYEDGQVELFYDNSKKLETTSAGVDVTGTLTVSNNTIISSSSDGAGGYHTMLQNNSTGDLYIRSTELYIQDNANANQAWIECLSNAGVKLHYAGATKFETTGTGIDVTGHTETDTLRVSGLSTFQNDVDINGDLDVSGDIEASEIRLNSYGNSRVIFGDNFGTNYAVKVGRETGGTNSTFTNTFVGYRAGYLAGTSNHSNNVFLGSYAGNDLTTSYGNVIIGKFDGNEGGLDLSYSPSNSGYIVLANGLGDVRYLCDSDGRTGINTTFITDTLTVGGNIKSTTKLKVGDSYEVASGLGTFTASAGVSTNVASFSASDYKVVEYKLWIQHANGIQSQKVIIMHDDNDVYTQESDIFFSNTLLIGAGATISGGTVSLSLTTETGVNGITTYRYSKQSLV